MSPLSIRRATEAEAGVLDNLKPRGMDGGRRNGMFAQALRELVVGLNEGDMTVELTGVEAERGYGVMVVIRAMLGKIGLRVSATLRKDDQGVESTILLRKR